MNARGHSVDNELVNLGLILIGTLSALAGVLWSAGAVTGLMSGTGLPASGIEGGFRVFAHPSNPAGALETPGMPALVYWLVFAVMAGLLSTAALLLWRLIAGTRLKTARDPHRLAGVATARDIASVASEHALLARGPTLRPSLSKPKAKDMGYQLGRSRGKNVWASVEDSILLLGPPRSGKGLHFTASGRHRDRPRDANGTAVRRQHSPG